MTASLSYIRSLFLMLLALLFGGCQLVPGEDRGVASSGDDPAAARTLEIPDDPDPALWVVRDEDTTVYLFGTIHFLPKGLSWFDEAVKDSFDQSDEF